MGGGLVYGIGKFVRVYVCMCVCARMCVCVSVRGEHGRRTRRTKETHNQRPSDRSSAKCNRAQPLKLRESPKVPRRYHSVPETQRDRSGCPQWPLGRVSVRTRKPCGRKSECSKQDRVVRPPSVTYRPIVSGQGGIHSSSHAFPRPRRP